MKGVKLVGIAVDREDQALNWRIWAHSIVQAQACLAELRAYALIEWAQVLPASSQ